MSASREMPKYECTCAAKDMPFGRCCKVTPNANVTGLAPGKDDK